jgi:hypothetical protein
MVIQIFFNVSAEVGQILGNVVSGDFGIFDIPKRVNLILLYEKNWLLQGIMG